MKKAYINPQTLVIEVQLQQLILGSTESVAIGSDVSDASGAQARRNSFWDDEDED